MIDEDKVLVASLTLYARKMNTTARNHGFWDQKYDDNTKIVLMHCELSEVVEALRHNDPPDQHCPEFKSSEIEFADCIIRILDFCHERELRIGEAIIAKMAFNKTRPYKHGKEF